MTRATVTKKVRQALVADGLRDGKSIGDLADALGVHRNTIGRDVRDIAGSVEAWADGSTRDAKMAAIATYQWAIDEAKNAYDESWRTLRKWLAGAYDRTEVRPDPDGGMREVRKPPVLKLEMAAYLDKAISANAKLAKMAGVEGAEKHEVSGKDGGSLIIRQYVGIDPDEV